MRRAFLAIWLAGAASGQTLVNLGSQTKNVDFSAAPETRPMKTGTTLPGACNVGDEFFNTAATAGSNVYGCTSPNVWTQLSGAGGGGGVGFSTFQPFITDAQVSSTATTVTIPGVIFRDNNTVTALSSTATIQANAGSLAAGSQVWIEFDPVAKVRFLVSNANVTQSNLTLANISAGVSNAGGFTSGRIPIATCSGGSTPDNWTACTDARTPFATQGFTAGAGINISAADTAGNQQISATGTLSNPAVYKTSINGTASCPSTETTLSNYQFPSAAGVAAGDSLDIMVWFQKTGSSNPAIFVRVDGTYANDPANLGNLSMGSAIYALHARGIVLSSSSIVYNFEVHRDAGVVIEAGSSLFTGATITSTPLVEFRASGCTGTDTVKVLGAVISLYKAASL
jgi:hypothetical protein